MALWPFCSPRLPKKNLHRYSASRRQAEAVAAELLERSSLERGTGAEGSSKGSVMLLRDRCRGVAPLCLGVDTEAAVSTAIRTAYHACVQAYSYIQLCNNVWLFRGMENLYAMSPKLPLTVLTRRMQNLFLFPHSRFALNSTSAALSLSSSQNMMPLASLPLNTRTYVHTGAQSFTTNISIATLFWGYPMGNIFLLTFSISHKLSRLLQNYEGNVLCTEQFETIQSSPF